MKFVFLVTNLSREINSPLVGCILFYLELNGVDVKSDGISVFFGARTFTGWQCYMFIHRSGTIICRERLGLQLYGQCLNYTDNLFSEESESRRGTSVVMRHLWHDPRGHLGGCDAPGFPRGGREW